MSVLMTVYELGNGSYLYYCDPRIQRIPFGRETDFVSWDTLYPDAVLGTWQVGVGLDYSSDAPIDRDGARCLWCDDQEATSSFCYPSRAAAEEALALYRLLNP